MKTLRIGFAGLGGICRQRHVPGLRALEGIELAAVANRSRASSEAAAREFGIPEVCGDWRELVARDGLDAVFVGTWPYLHRDISIAALRAGKHVFCQARMAMNAAEAREMAEVAPASGRVAALCPVPIGLSVDRTIRRLLESGELGRVFLVRVQSLSGANLDANAPLTWRKDHRLSGLNMLTLGMYIEVIHRWFGWTRAISSAQTDIFTPQRRDADGNLVDVRIPDQVLFNAEMENGISVQYLISGMARHGGDAIEIYGEHKTLRYDATADVLYELTTDGGLRPIAIRPEDAYDVQHWRVERDFVDAVRHGAEYHPDFNDGLKYMEVIQAVYDATEQQRSIKINA